MIVGQATEIGTGTQFEECVSKSETLTKLVKLPQIFGCIITGHSLWHIFSLIAFLMNSFNRELLLEAR